MIIIELPTIYYLLPTYLSKILAAAPKLNVPPRFRDTAFFDKGENVVIKIPFTGHPKPRITWVREGETIESGGHYHVEVKDRHAILTIRDGSRLDSGPYRITAENDLGQDSAIIKIQISGNCFALCFTLKCIVVLVSIDLHYYRSSRSTTIPCR